MTKLHNGKRTYEEESVAGKFSLRGQPHFISPQEGEGQNIPEDTVNWLPEGCRGPVPTIDFMIIHFSLISFLR